MFAIEPTGSQNAYSIRLDDPEYDFQVFCEALTELVASDYACFVTPGLTTSRRPYSSCLFDPKPSLRDVLALLSISHKYCDSLIENRAQALAVQLTDPEVILSHLSPTLRIENIAETGIATGSTDLVVSVAKILLHDVKTNRRSITSVLEFAESLGDPSFLGDVYYEAMLRGPRFEGFTEHQISTFCRGAWKCVEAFDEIVFSWVHSNQRYGYHECDGGYSPAEMIDQADLALCPYDDFHEEVLYRCAVEKVAGWDIIRKLEIATTLEVPETDYPGCHEAARSNAQLSLHEIRRRLPSFFAAVQ